MRYSVVLIYVGLLWAQDSVRAIAHMRGDYVEVAFEWKGQSGKVPLGANFVLRGSPAAPIAWQLTEITSAGRWDGAHSNQYFPLYTTARAEPDGAFRLSLNLLAKQPPTGDAFTGEWEYIGTWRAPVLDFGDTLHLHWAMETGEIVLAPFQRAKERFVLLAPAPLRLCPDFPALRLVEASGNLRIEGLEDFRPENLTIRWYREGVFVAQGNICTPEVAGLYYAEVRHRCGSQALTDTFAWHISTVAMQESRGWRLYPNPTTGTIWIESPRSASFSAKLWDGAGRCLFTHEGHTTASEAYRLSFPALPAGLYRLTLTSDRETLTFPIAYAP